MDQRVQIKLLQKKVSLLEELVKAQELQANELKVRVADRTEKLQSAEAISAQRALEIQQLHEEIASLHARLAKVNKLADANEAWAKDTLAKNVALVQQLKDGSPLLVQCVECKKIRPGSVGACFCGNVTAAPLSWMNAGEFAHR